MQINSGYPEGGPEAILTADFDDPQVTSRLAELMEEAGIPGFSIAVFNDQEILFSRALGVKSVETGGAVGEDTIFIASSLGKCAFAYMALQLVEEGILDLDKPLFQYKVHERLSHDERHSRITARMVLSHSSGLPNWQMGPIYFIANPGEGFTYSGEGYVYLAEIVQLLTGKPFPELVQDRVFDPLGMTKSSFTWRPDFEEDFAVGHDEFIQTVPRDYLLTPNVAFSLQTTAADYSRLMMAFLRREGLRADLSEAMLSPQTTIQELEDGRVAWGLGIGLLEKENEKVYWQWGGHNWFSSLAFVVESRRLGFVFMANCINGFGIPQELIRLFIGSFFDSFGALGETPYHLSFKRIIRQIARGLSFAEAIAPFLSQDGTQLNEAEISEAEMQELGQLLFESNRKEEARELFKWGIATFPNSAGAMECYAEACLVCGFPEEAARYYAEVFRLNPDHQKASQIVRYLEGKAEGNTVFKLPGYFYAKHVSLAGDFNYWDKTSMPFVRRNGVWICPVELQPGIYNYKFIVDGVWILDPGNPRTIFSEQHNSVFEVAAAANASAA